MVNRDVHLLRTIVVDWSPNSGGSPEVIVSGWLFGSFSRQFFGAATLFVTLIFLVRLNLIEWIQD